MSVGTIIDSTTGVVTSKGTSGLTIQTALSTSSGVAISAGGLTVLSSSATNPIVGVSPFKVASVLVLTNHAIMSAHSAGVTTISGAAAKVITMPSASLCPGAEFIIRTLSVDAHVLTASQETPGTRVFLPSGMLTITGSSTLSGSKITFTSGLVGQSIVLKCDGIQYFVTCATSGATISGT